MAILLNLVKVVRQVLARELGVQSGNKHVRIPHASSDADVSGLADDWTTRVPPASCGLAALCNRHDCRRFRLPLPLDHRHPVLSRRGCH